MTEQEQNIAIAEYRGWTNIQMNYATYSGEPYDYLEGILPEPYGYKSKLPNFYWDKNEVDKFLNWLESSNPCLAVEYPDVLNWVILNDAGIKPTKRSMPAGQFRMLVAPPKQCCEAIVRLLGKWVE